MTGRSDMQQGESDSPRLSLAGVFRGRGLMRCRQGLQAIGFILLASVSLHAAEIGPSEYELKAAVIYHFNKYIQWPQAAESSNAPIVVGIYGKGPFGPIIDGLFKQAKPIEGRQVHVRRISNPTEAKSCRIVFIGDTEKATLNALLKSLGSSPVLTIGERDDFCALGGMIKLRMVENRVRFEINVKTGEQAGLQFSSKLLRQAIEGTSSK